MMSIFKCLVLCSFTVFFVSCTTLTTHCVAYQSVKTRHAQPGKSFLIPEEAKIIVGFAISSEGGLTAVVYNRTSEVMIIDQTKSFFVNSDGSSTSYYDPTVKTTTETDLSSVNRGLSVNLGPVANAFGVGGIVGNIASGINVGGSGTSGKASTHTTYVADQPYISLSPNSNTAMSKVFKVIGLGKNAFNINPIQAPSLKENESYCRFSVCITYSTDNGTTFEKIVTDFYADSMVIIPVEKKGKVNGVNDALCKVYATKPDALYEPWWMLYFMNNVNLGNDCRIQGVLYDYQ